MYFDLNIQSTVEEMCFSFIDLKFLLEKIVLIFNQIVWFIFMGESRVRRQKHPYFTS